MKWAVLAIGIAVAAIVSVGIVGLGVTHYYCMPLGHITPMICRIPPPPDMPLKPMPIPHANYH
jgi:hypothetical protein